ncbi:hypothetical protein VPH35_075910 [Triticum aestivum]
MDRTLGLFSTSAPCFPRATSIVISWRGNICFKQPQSSEFSALETLSLCGASVIGIDTLITRCPCLRVLRVIGLIFDIKVHSVSLQTLDVTNEHVWISSIDIVTPKLKQLELSFGADTDLSVSISAPMLEKVVWDRWFTETTHLFGCWHLETINLRSAHRFTDGHFCSRSFRFMHRILANCFVLQDQLGYELEMAHEVEFAQEMEKLPVINFSVLKLFIVTDGHVFGALVWRLLGLHQSFAAMKRLIERTCPENCPCDKPKNWRCHSISLTRLEEVHIKNFNGEEHEHDFLKLIFRSSPMLNRVTLKLVYRFGGCTQKIYNTFWAYPDVKGYVYFWSGQLVPQPSD